MMNKKYFALISLLIILTFIGYIVYNTVTSGKASTQKTENASEPAIQDQWIISREMTPEEGPLLSVAVSAKGEIYLGGDSWLSCYNRQLSRKWTLKTSGRISSVAVNGDTIFASSGETILLISADGKVISEWGPYEANSIITSLTANKLYVAFADAGVKRVFILKKNGELFTMIGQSDRKFIIPSPYFDVAFYGLSTLFVANTGNRRIETFTTDGRYINYFGEAGTAPEAFSGCCNPAHFAVIPQGFVTAEKGINRIKILDPDGKFIEFVSSQNKFTPSVPLDVASVDGKTIYAANSADSKLYIFKRK
jgi:DNA-binding beta-propeller fold protein YncE